MKTIFSKDDDDMVLLEFICEELNEQYNLILVLVERYKEERPHLTQQFKEKKQLLSQILHESSKILEVRNNFLNRFSLKFVDFRCRLIIVKCK